MDTERVARPIGGGLLWLLYFRPGSQAPVATVKSLQKELYVERQYGDYLASDLAAGFFTRQIGNTYNVVANAIEQTITATGSFTKNGETQLAADIHLAVNLALTDANPNRPLDLPPTLDAEVFELPWLRGYGNVKSLHVAYQESPALRQAARDLIAQGREGILTNFDGFMAKWTGLEVAHAAHGVTRTNLTIEDKVRRRRQSALLSIAIGKRAA